MEKKGPGWMAVGLTAVCTIALIYTIFTLIQTLSITQKASDMYNHPYTVARQARDMRNRLLEVENHLPSMIVSEYQDLSDIRDILEEREESNLASLEIIRDSYSGPAGDVAALARLLDALFKARWEAMDYAQTHTNEETLAYLESEVTPLYTPVNDALKTILNYSDSKIQSLMSMTQFSGYMSIAGSILLCLAIILLAAVTGWNERRKNQEIEYREMLFDLLSTNIDDVFFIYDRDSGKMEYVSENCSRILGVGKSAFQTDVLSLYHALTPEAIREIESMFSDGPLRTPAQCEIPFAHSGDKRNLKIRMYPVLKNNHVCRYIAVLSDQTEAMAHQQALRDALTSAQSANAAKRDFLSRMSHEIRTPMNAIIGMTAIALSHVHEEERVEDCLGKITYSSKHLLSLINDVLDMSKIEDGKLIISHEHFNFRQMIESVTAIVYPQTVERGQDFEVSVTGLEQEILMGDALRINQILLNLISNALKFTPEGGKIRLEVSQLRERNSRAVMRFVVKDTGIGMSGEFLNRLYTPFEQADNSISQKYGGTGLGMSITKNLVTMMGGTINVKSAPGKGTAFTVEIPLELLKEAVPDRSRPELESLNVLIADDDRDCCEHAAILLQKFGLKTHWVLSGSEAVDVVKNAHDNGDDYDVCFIDWRMPGMDGIETTRRIRQFLGPETLIIIISAYDWNPIEQPAREAGANAFISKPFFASSLYNTLLSVANLGSVTAQGPSDAKQQYGFMGKKLLLAEDNDLNREIAVEILNMAGLEIDCAYNGQEALDMFRSSDPGQYSAILMDIQMPVMNGYQSAEAIRSCSHADAASIPIIAMTANAFTEDVSTALACGMNGHLAKPVDPDMLYQTLNSYLQV